jgi:hypothetical protein
MDPRPVWEFPIKVQEGVGASRRLDEWRRYCGRAAAIQKTKPPERSMIAGRLCCGYARTGEMSGTI